jgi:hypothetical protein
MVDKYSGRVAYAVIPSVAFWAAARSIIPCPGRCWDYDIDMGGYMVDLDEETLKGAGGSGLGDIVDYAFCPV